MSFFLHHVLLLLLQKSTSNYHARRFGVRAAMPGFIAKKLCPGLIIVPTNFDKYRAVSEEVRTGQTIQTRFYSFYFCCEN